MIFKILFRVIRRYWSKSYYLIIISSSLNILLAVCESLSVLLLPLLISYKESFLKFKSYQFFYVNNLSLNSYLFIFTLTYIFILALIYVCRNISLFYSSKFANKISIEYSKDFIESFSKQGLDAFNKFSKDKLNTYIQAKFPLVSREVFFPFTQIFSSLMITIFLIGSAIFLSPFISLFLIIFVAIIYLYISFIAAVKLKYNGKIINRGLEDQGYFSSLFYDSLFLFKENFNDFSFKKYLFDNEKKIKTSQTRNLIFSSLPKNTIEFFLLSFIVSVICYLNINNINNVSNNIIISIIFAFLKSILALQQFSRSIYLVQSNSANIIDIEKVMSNFKINKLLNYYTVNEKLNKSNILIRFNAIKLDLKSAINRQFLADFSIKDKDFVLIDAPSGTGKTRFLNFIAGHLPQKEGELIFNKSVFNKGKLNLYFIPQKQLFLNLKVRDFLKIKNQNDYNNFKNNLKKLSEICKCEKDFFFTDISSNIDEFLKRKISSLSGGQYQKVCLFVCLIKFPNIVLLDESFSAIDSQSENNYFKILKNYILNKKDCCIIYTSHNINSKKYANKIFKLCLNKFVDKF